MAYEGLIHQEQKSGPPQIREEHPVVWCGVCSRCPRYQAYTSPENAASLILLSL